MDRTHRTRARTASRGPAHRTVSAVAAAVATPVLLLAGAAAPASAHGAPTDPVSRVSACSPEGGSAGTAACRAAVAANGAPFTAWDNLRVAGVNGRDRQVVPDGKLCSGGLAAYKGLDLARADWPSTRLTPGATLKLTYRTTIPHTGTFKMYLTKPGYDPSKPLTWSDLADRPFAQVTDPPLSNGAYRFSAKLPSDRTGRHVLYTIWQNTSTVDTYYSCSDVDFPKAARRTDTSERGAGGAAADGGRKAGGGGAGASAAPSARRSASAPATARATPDTETGGPSAGAEGSAGSGARTAVSGSPVSSASRDGSGVPVTPVAAGGAAALVVVAGAALLTRRRGRRPGGRHGRG